MPQYMYLVHIGLTHSSHSAFSLTAQTIISDQSSDHELRALLSHYAHSQVIFVTDNSELVSISHTPVGAPKREANDVLSFSEKSVRRGFIRKVGAVNRFNVM